MHISVLLEESLNALSISGDGKYIDCTLGGGGHSEEILKKSTPNGKLLGIDRDIDAIDRCRERLSPFAERFRAVHANFSQIKNVAQENDFQDVDGIIMDLGVSSFQLDERERGFSFIGEGPLDMRMDTTKGKTAAELIDSMGDDWKSLAKIISDYGEEKQAGKIARAIIEEHLKEPICTTLRLANIVEKAVGGRKGSPRHPATKTFQALRIEVNNEFNEIREGINDAINLLRIGGRLAIISFHSIEDRIVKTTLAAHEGKRESLYQGGSIWKGVTPAVKRVTKHPILPSEQEINSNPRARSAKLRVVERVLDPQ